MYKYCIACLISALLSAPAMTQTLSYINDSSIISSLSEASPLDDEVVSFEQMVDTLPFAHPTPSSQLRANYEPTTSQLREMSMKNEPSNAPQRTAASSCPTDSIVGKDAAGNYVSLKTYTYDSAGRTIEEAEWKWVNGVKTGVSKKQTEFYDNGKKKADASWTWDSTKKDWRGSTRNEYSYDDSDRTTKWDILQWLNDEWVGKTRYLYSYAFPNDANNMAWSEQYNYDTAAKDWVGYTRSDYEYNASKRRTLAMTSNWSTTSQTWVPQKKYVYEYDGTTSNKTLDLYYSAYTASTDTWGGNGSYKYIATYYNSTSTKLIDEKYTWDTSKKDWKGSSKIKYDYKTAGKKTLTLKYKWDNSLWDWVYNTVDSIKYDDANREIDKVSYQWSNEAWTGNGTRTTTSYISAGKTEEQILWKWTADGWVKNTKTGYVYNGTLTTEEYAASWNGTDWVKTTSKIFSYNAANKNDTTLTYQLVGTELVLTSRTYYVYDDRGNTIFTHNASRKDNTWKLSSATRLDVKYDDAGRLTLSITWYCSFDSIWQGDQKEVYQYATSGKQLFAGKYKCENGIWNPSYEVTCEYDEQNRELLNQRFDWSNGVRKATHRYEYTYRGNDKDPYITAFYSGWSTVYNNWVGISKSEKLFNDEGKEIGSISYTWSDNAWVGMFRNTYTYDSSNRELEHIMERYINSEWVNNEKYEKEYQGSKQTKNNSYTWDGSTWIYRSRSEKTYDEDAAAKLRTELVASYSSGNLTSYDFKRYHYACDPHAYLIRFLNWDGTVVSEQNLDAGVTPVCDSIPVRSANDSTTYTFKAWTPTVVPVSGPATYIATFDSVTIAFPITFVNYDGTTLQSEVLAYGKIPTYEGPKPSKPANDSMTFTFKDWSPTIVSVTQAATYTATFDSTRVKFFVTFVNYDGSELQKTEYAYGTTPVYTGTTPTKPANARYTYTFKGWKPTIVSVTEATTYTADYDSTSVKYFVTFANYDGTELQKTEYAYGAAPSYTGSQPTKPANAQYTYTFKGWKPAIVDVTEAATYTADYDSTSVKYFVTFANYDGSELQKTEYAYGATPSYTGTTPIKPANAQYIYNFKGWQPTIVSVTEAATYTADYDSTSVKYFVTFANYDGSELQKTEYAYGATPAYTGSTPTKPADAQYTYTFGGWDKTVVAVVADAEYTATYTSTVNQYTITFKDADGTTLESKKWDYGSTPACSEPSKPSDARYAYAFKAWSPTISEVKAEATYTATYDTTAILYTVTFANYDGKVLQSQDYPYGATPKYTGVTPYRASTKEYAYAFKAWAPKVVPVTENAVYTATYDSTEIISYVTITFLNYDSTIIYSQVVRYKRQIMYEGPTPTRKPSAHYTYTFKSWTPSLSIALENTIYIAQYDSVTRYYAIRFANYDGTILQSDELLYGETPVYRGFEPTREEDDYFTYTFSGWTPSIAPVAADVTYIATYLSEPRNTSDRHPYADGPDETRPIYNILGNPVSADYHGIVIQDGRKYLR